MQKKPSHLNYYTMDQNDLQLHQIPIETSQLVACLQRIFAVQCISLLHQILVETAQLIACLQSMIEAKGNSEYYAASLNTCRNSLASSLSIVYARDRRSFKIFHSFTRSSQKPQLVMYLQSIGIIRVAFIFIDFEMLIFP